MPTPVYTPRVNNNDDIVKLNHVYPQPGSFVKAGDALADVETDKATFAVEAEVEGYVLSVEAGLGDMIEVGTVLMWLGAEPGETVPRLSDATANAAPARMAEASVKALLLLSQYGLAPKQVPASGDRLSAADVLDYIGSKGLAPLSAAAPAGQPNQFALPAGGKRVPLSLAERGMARAVVWHRDQAVPGYCEIAYDPSPWQTYSDDFRAKHGLLFNPLLPLMAKHLVTLASETRGLNTTLAGEERFVYDSVNAGFTMQSGSVLYMLVVQAAETLTEADFVARLGGLQRRAMRNELRPEESSGSTIAFTSMSRWQISRHIPVLPPYNSLIVAHSAPSGGQAMLGATYDHRVLTGGDVAVVLTRLAQPPESGIG
jgi:pyruvate dehydrogenase E2 component (dihydrolipoamide acetyltransferase)